MSSAAPAGGAPTVPSCHSDDGTRMARPGAAVVALAGAPNVGKSTLFNALTGARRQMGNWPGTSVEVGRGAWRLGPGTGRNGKGRTGHEEVALVDLPGAYSLDPSSPDEALTRALLVDVPPAERPDVVVVVTDAAHLARSLYLVAQLRELEQRLVVALTMADVAARRGLQVDVPALAAALGVAVVAVDPRHRVDVQKVGDAVALELRRPAPPPRPVGPDVTADELALADDRFAWINRAVEAGTGGAREEQVSGSDRADRWLTAPVTGPLAFLGAMWVVFQLTTTVAAPLQDLLARFFSGPVTAVVATAFRVMGGSGSAVEGFVLNGLVAGVGMVLTFVPLMAIMFALLALLEDSGYMARAAVVTDRLMRAIGLPGRAFLPLVVGFGCNVPAIAATRTLSNARHRLLTALLVPFTSCSARLTVYVLVARIFFPAQAGTVVFAMYVVSIALVVVIGLLLKSTLWRAVGNEPLVLDLPPFQFPTVRLTAAMTWDRLKGFLRTAAGIIVVTVAVVWTLQAMPVRGEARFGHTPVEDSAYGVVAKGLAPVFKPAGFGDWRISSSLVVGFVAKETIISSWAQTYAVDDPGESGEPGQLGESIRRDFQAASGGHTVPAVLAFLVFLLAYTPCVATIAAQRREIGLRWTLFGIGLQLLTAWLLAVGVFQLLSWWW